MLIYDSLRKMTSYLEWNTFTPSAAIDSPRNSVHPDFLTTGDTFSFVVIIDPTAPQNKTQSPEKVFDISTPCPRRATCLPRYWKMAASIPMSRRCIEPARATTTLPPRAALWSPSASARSSMSGRRRACITPGRASGARWQRRCNRCRPHCRRDTKIM